MLTQKTFDFFLGGTCVKDSCGQTWRDTYLTDLTNNFNPVVDNWTPECQDNENYQRVNTKYCVYVITPLMKGYLSLAEIGEDLALYPNRLIYSYVSEYNDNGTIHKFSDNEINELKSIGNTVNSLGGTWVKNISDIENVMVEKSKYTPIRKPIDLHNHTFNCTYTISQENFKLYDIFYIGLSIGKCNKNLKCTFIPDGFTEKQIKSIIAIGRNIEAVGGQFKCVY